MFFPNSFFVDISAKSDEILVKMLLSDFDFTFSFPPKALPFDFIEKTETIDSLGKGHFKEYKVNEYKIPEENREKVALTRVHGLLSIGDYIKSSGSKEQRFHYESSLKGALLYATSLGINIDEK